MSEELEYFSSENEKQSFNDNALTIEENKSANEVNGENLYEDPYINVLASSSCTSNNSNIDFDPESESKDKKLNDAIQLWTNFTDAEYLNYNKPIKTEVPKRPFFTYTFLNDQPIRLMNSPPKKSLPDVLEEMLINNLGAYCRIQIGDSHFYNCQPNVLRCYCAYFANRDWRISSFQFTKEELSSEGFELAYEWMRFRLPLEYLDTPPMMQAAKRLQIDLLELECWEQLSQDHIRERNAFEVYLRARGTPLLSDLRELMLSRVRTYFLALVGHDDFLSLSPEELMEIISLDSIGVNSEIEIFFSVLRWLNQNPNERQKHLRRIMECVRFAYMPMHFLFRLKDGCNRVDSEELFTDDPMLLAFHMDPHSLEMLEKAMILIGVRCQHDDNGEFVAICAEHRLKVQYGRNWVYHVGCPYHMIDLNYPYQHKFTAKDFYDYVSSIQLEWLGDGPSNYGQDRVINVPH